MITPHALLDQWARTVDDVEHGYALTYDDYLNDLDLRRSLADITLSPAERERLVGLDARFADTTYPSGECVWGVDNEQAEQWDRVTHWYYWRLPKHPGSAFRES